MSYQTKYTELDGKYHAIGQGEHTECGEVIPHGNGWVYDLPAKSKLHCGDKPGEESDEPFDNRPLEDPPTPLASDNPDAAPVVTKEAKPAATTKKTTTKAAAKK